MRKQTRQEIGKDLAMAIEDGNCNLSYPVQNGGRLKEAERSPTTYEGSVEGRNGRILYFQEVNRGVEIFAVKNQEKFPVLTLGFKPDNDLNAYLS